MKKILLFATLFCCSLVSFGQTFTDSGINYVVTSSTSPQRVAVAAHTSFTGTAVIPASVTNGGITYSVTSIGNNAFYNCTGLTNFTIPNSVKSIGQRAFQGCTGLTAVSIPNSVITIGFYAFANCTGLTSVSIPNSVTTIDVYTFAYCTGLTTVNMPNSVTTIGYAAFYLCTGLISVSIPNSVTTTGDYAFGDCTSLTSVVVNRAVPLTISAEVFYGVTLANVALQVPAGTLAAYQAKAVWKDFGTITLGTIDFATQNNIKIYPNPSNGIFNITIDSNATMEVFDLVGKQLKTAKINIGETALDLSNFNAGIYLLKITNELNQSKTLKLVKQ